MPPVGCGRALGVKHLSMLCRCASARCMGNPSLGVSVSLQLVSACPPQINFRRTLACLLPSPVSYVSFLVVHSGQSSWISSVGDVLVMASMAR